MKKRIIKKDGCTVIKYEDRDTRPTLHMIWNPERRWLPNRSPNITPSSSIPDADVYKDFALPQFAEKKDDDDWPFMMSLHFEADDTPDKEDDAFAIIELMEEKEDDISPVFGTYDMNVFCPWCGCPTTVTDQRFINSIRYGGVLPAPKEILCRHCDLPVSIDGTENLSSKTIKSDTHWTSVIMFDEKDSFSEGKIVVSMNYAATGVSENEKLFTEKGCVRFIMNMKSGMTYLRNGKINGRYPSPSIRAIDQNHPFNITYGNDYLCDMLGEGYLVTGNRRCSIINKLNEPEIIQFIAECMIRYKGLSKDDLTKEGDYSDTTIWRLCFVNSIPGAAQWASCMEKYQMALMSQFGDRYCDRHAPVKVLRKYVKNIRRTFSKGSRYVTEYYMGGKTGIPKSIRRLVAEDPFNYYVYSALKKIGFMNTDIACSFMKNAGVRRHVAILDLAGRKNQPAGMKRFIRQMMDTFGEKKTLHLLAETMDRAQYFKDAYMMYDAMQGNVVLQGRNIKEIHDNILRRFNSMNGQKNTKFSYSKKEERLEGSFDDIAFVLPTDRNELSDASQRLHNCVRGYWKPVLEKQCVIVLMKPAEKPDRYVGCIEIRRNTVIQAYAPCNKYFDEKTHEVFKKWCEKNGLKGYANGWEPDTRVG